MVYFQVLSLHMNEMKKTVNILRQDRVLGFWIHVKLVITAHNVVPSIKKILIY